MATLSSSTDKEKKTLDEAACNQTTAASLPPPPSYDQHASEYDRENTLDPPDITAGFSNLSLSKQSTNNSPTPHECIAHLKVLECFYRLRQSVGSHDGLYGIKDSLVIDGDPQTEAKKSELLSKLAEKRWAIFVCQAVQRFESWWAAMTPNARLITRTALDGDGRSGRLCDRGSLIDSSFHLDTDSMPPVDVLMVWHAFMLNPRAYLEDCLRYGRMDSWHTSFPWESAVNCINSETFAFEVSDKAMSSFIRLTGFSWDAVGRSNTASIYCPSCDHQNLVPLTTCFDSDVKFGPLSASIDPMLSSGVGFCDKDFTQRCESCKFRVTRDSMQVRKFRLDLRLLLDKNVPLRGTLLGTKGIPWSAFGEQDPLQSGRETSPNSLFTSGGLSTNILPDEKEFGKATQMEKMEDIRDVIDAHKFPSDFVKQTGHDSVRQMSRAERAAIRRMMSRYWNNESSFALDLVGAVIRQGSFIEKMHTIDWLHSPALHNTMGRLITKYSRFMTIMSQHPDHMAVPTLDVDLAWHTHQLSPSAYMRSTIKLTKQFIDHDDKVAETKLNDAFAWTSKTYQKLYSEPYSECTCWYCEAVRESQLSTGRRLRSSLFPRSLRVRHASNREPASLHVPDQDPRKSVHISAHNAVRPSDGRTYDLLAAYQARILEKHYQKACERARKKGRRASDRNDYYYSDAWGYPVYIPAYSPYVGFVPYAPMYYPVTPGCMAVGAGAAGNCCQGTCGGVVGAGGFGGNGCASGGGAGSCGGGGGGGNCGGGGGGGGGGCGGGGGGGGCGGGGG